MTPAEQSNYDIMRFLTKLTTYYLTLSKKGMWTWSDNSKPKSDEEDQTLTALSACIKKIDDLKKTLAKQEHNKSGKNQTKKKKGQKFPSLRHPNRHKNPPKEGDSEEYTYPDGKVFWCKTHGWNASHMTPDCRGTKADQDPTTDSDATNTSKQGTIASLSHIPILKS